mmetsp:Transcript_66306/g.138212  ORF Transcript_66306/g.138212 Transcript_66306/m.138212 type:complete len:204 (+) Transcript_66306:143-754(+)
MAVEVDVHLEELELRRDPELQLVLVSKLLYVRYERGVLVARHGREEVVLELVLHPSPEPLGEGVGADSIASGAELGIDELGLLLEEKLFRLMRYRGDDGGHEAREEEGAEVGGEGDEGQHHGPVRREPYALHHALALDGNTHAVEAPDEEEERHREGKIPPLQLAPWGIVLGVWGPEEERGVGGNVLVLANFVGACVMEVVLV